jgi:eukaryotic-like serine/threonine-protein kinase
VTQGSEQLPEDIDLTGQLVGGKYRVEHLVGSGGMGTVWAGIHEVLKTRVAIKFIRPMFAEREEARRRFEIEARAAANVQSKHAVQVYDYGVEAHGLPYIVMEYLEGESLSEALIRRGPLPAPEVAKLIGQASRALQKAHDAGIVHRDLKPDNIFLATNVEGVGDLPYTVKLVDFGIAKLLQDPGGAGEPFGGPTQTGAVIGTPNFMSPEQLTVGGAPGALTDLWSLGACTFAAMTARIPFEGEILGDIVLKVCVAPMPVASHLNADVPQGFDAWFARACNRDPTKRFQSASELAETLASVCGLGRVQVATFEEDRIQYVLRPTGPVHDLTVPDDDEIPRGMSSRTALLAGLLLGVTLMVGVVMFFVWRDRMSQEAFPPPPAVSADAAAPRTR